MLVRRYYQHLSGFLSNCHLSRVPSQAHLSANYKGNNEVKPGAILRSPDIHVTARENPGKPQLGNTCSTNHRLKWNQLSPSDVGGIMQHVREDIIDVGTTSRTWGLSALVNICVNFFFSLSLPLSPFPCSFGVWYMIPKFVKLY